MDELIPLSLANLERLPESVSRPTYSRSDLSPGIVHIGVGNFHRAHQAWYLHRLMQGGEALDWAIIGAGVRSPHDAKMRDRLSRQEFLTTLVELDPSGISAEVIGSVIDYLPVEDGNSSLIQAMADPRIRLVTLTVTEGGYFVDPITGGFDCEHEDIVFDAEHPDKPKTAFGAIVAALKIRRDQRNGPFSIQSCDNLQGNGDVVRQTTVALARLTDPELADWIDQTCSFPNSMVDCIVPSTGEKELNLVRQLGIDDSAPVTHENFRQWVIEDDFCAGRPDWDKVGAIFTDRVHDYEIMKLRILNAGHQILANAGEILSRETIADCMMHDGIKGLFSKVQMQEIVPQVNPAPDMNPAHYVDLVALRFSNTAIVDTTRRVAFDGSSRHTGFILPIIRERLADGASVQGLALVEALWARMCQGTREDGSRIEPNDPCWEALSSAAGKARHRPQAWLEQRQYYGDLAETPAFATSFENWLRQIWDDGCEAVLARYASTEYV
ncbi:MAG: mannitol dehydrogenase family protein [Pseudomonadota bacterium]